MINLDFVPVVLGSLGAVTGYLFKKIIDSDKLITAHLASDTVAFASIDQNFMDLKTGQNTQSAKLDRLIEHSRDGVSTQQACLVLSSAASSAINVVEAAKAAALIVVAAAAEEAKHKR